MVFLSSHDRVFFSIVRQRKFFSLAFLILLPYSTMFLQYKYFFSFTELFLNPIIQKTRYKYRQDKQSFKVDLGNKRALNLRAEKIFLGFRKGFFELQKKIFCRDQIKDLIGSNLYLIGPQNYHNSKIEYDILLFKA